MRVLFIGNMPSFSKQLRECIRSLMTAFGDLNPPNPLKKGAKSQIQSHPWEATVYTQVDLS
jgi:hypothetical protein